MRQANIIRTGRVQSKHVNWRPVTHVSRTNTDAERNYAQIEGESLATFYGVWRLRRYLYGDKFQPHHNKRKLGTMRVERHKLKLKGFNFEFIFILLTHRITSQVWIYAETAGR